MHYNGNIRLDDSGKEMVLIVFSVSYDA